MFGCYRKRCYLCIVIRNKRTTKNLSIMKTSKSDQSFIMNTTLLEVAVAESLRTDDLRLIHGKSGAWYVVSAEVKEDGKPVKVYFKKTFN